MSSILPNLPKSKIKNDYSPAHLDALRKHIDIVERHRRISRINEALRLSASMTQKNVADLLGKGSGKSVEALKDLNTDVLRNPASEPEIDEFQSLIGQAPRALLQDLLWNKLGVKGSQVQRLAEDKNDLDFNTWLQQNAKDLVQAINNYGLTNQSLTEQHQKKVELSNKIAVLTEEIKTTDDDDKVQELAQQRKEIREQLKSL